MAKKKSVKVLITYAKIRALNIWIWLKTPLTVILLLIHSQCTKSDLKVTIGATGMYLCHNQIVLRKMTGNEGMKDRHCSECMHYGIP